MKIFLTMGKWQLLGFLSALIIIGCSSSGKLILNDFFGIQMPPEEFPYFKIVSYKEDTGIKYKNTLDMNPNIYAWAGIRGNEIQIKIVNNTDKPLPSNFINDRFSITTINDKIFFIDKGRLNDYPTHNYIKARGQLDYVFKLPTHFWETIGTSRTTNYLEEFWTGMDTEHIRKSTVKLITITLGGSNTIILKAVPKKRIKNKN